MAAREPLVLERATHFACSWISNEERDLSRQHQVGLGAGQGRLANRPLIGRCACWSPHMGMLKSRRGGTEMAAYQLYRGLRARSDCEAWFLGCRPSGGTERPGLVITQPFDEGEFVYTAGAFDWFKFANRDPNFPREFRALLRELRPDVMHFHHFINFGVDAFGLVRDALPGLSPDCLDAP